MFPIPSAVSPNKHLLDALVGVPQPTSTPGTNTVEQSYSDRTGLTRTKCFGLPAKVTCNIPTADACWPAISLIGHRVCFAGHRNQAPCVLANKQCFRAPEKVIRVDDPF